MEYYVYRDGNTVKIRQGDRSIAEVLIDQFGSANLGSKPYQSRAEAVLYQSKWQKNVDADPAAKPPYSIEKD
jgi:hypothetical protein